MNTTGNPEGGERDPGTGTHRTESTELSGGETGGPDSPAGGEPLGEYGYTGGYGYGPGYGDPDGGEGYSYGPGYGSPDVNYADQPGPAYARPGDADEPMWGVAEAGEDPGPSGPPPGPPGPGGGAVAYQSLQPVVEATPALKGYPGGPGLDTLTDDPATRGTAEPGAGRDVRDLNSPSVWQNAQRAWRDSGVEWQRPGADYEPAEAEWERVQAAAPAKRRGISKLGGSGQPSGRLAAPAVTGMSASVARQERRVGGQTKPPRRPDGGPRAGRAGGRGGRWGLTAVAVVVLAGLAFGGYELFGHKSNHPAASSQYPPARPAGRILTTNPGQGGRNIFQSVTAVSESSGRVVAAGAESGQWLPRTQFLVSTDGGKIWQLGTVRAAAGATASVTAMPPQMIAHGPAGWLAVGNGTYWTSQDGKTWTQAAGHLPVQRGDQTAGLAATAKGFVVVGDNVPPGNPGLRSAVAWTSSNGVTWQRLSGPRLLLHTSNGRALRIRAVAAHGSDVLMYGNTLTTTGKGKGKHKVTSVNNVLWVSGNGGSSWAVSNLPLGKGQANAIDGIAATGAGFVAIRPATSKTTGPDAVAYTSPNGTTWTTGGTIAASKSAHLAITTVAGSDQGVVVAGHESGGAHAVFVSTNGASWHGLTGVGGASQTLAGLTVAAGGTVVAGGYGPLSPVGQFPYLALAASGKPVTPVSFASIPGATGPSMGVAGLASAAGHQVAAGTANGYPAIWTGSGDRWTQVSAPALTRPGLSTLTAVAHGKAGWVAVGGTLTGAPVRPIVLGSADGTSWQAADSESAFKAPGITLHAAAAGAGGYLVAGQEAVPARTITKTVRSGKHKKRVKQTVPAHTEAVAWWSSGLTGWTQVLTSSGPPTRVINAVTINAVTADGPGFVAVGTAGGQPAAWTSPDGKTWKLTQLGPPGNSAVAALHQVAVYRHLIVATGTSADTSGVTSAFSEYSTDGGTLWQQEPLTVPASPSTATALTTTRSGIVAVGTSGPLGHQHVVVWWTTAGFSWKTIEPTGTGLTSQGSQGITALTATGSALTGTGYLVTPNGEQPTLWHATAGP